eukprot:TRINITY_DN22232_c0_g1_i1.p1 TRINITY_DN22232_c0_g1~~TRINITY_DN22232_c0_g1_i1.p1  ORF type:complete len:827 (+),score=126.58 TRINITY_DN22232_c0_g1_i1:79-2559(+)
MANSPQPQRGVLTCTFLVALVCSCCRHGLWFADGAIYRHEIVDGKFREVACDALSDCWKQGMSTPLMVMHRTWAIEIEEALQKRSEGIEAAGNSSRIIARHRAVRRAIQQYFLKSRSDHPQEVPDVRLVRRFMDEERGVSVSMLLFEAWKGQAVPAILYVPLGLEPGHKLPAVLHLPGHLARSIRDPAEQRIALTLAQRGYVVFSFDPISQGERMQYDAASNDLECRAECPADDGNRTNPGIPQCSVAHDHFGKQLWLLGRSAAEIFVSDAQRALDFLVELPFVDEENIGAVGCSGGGMLTAYLGAVDARIKASMIACYFSSLARELEGGTCAYDAEQVLWNSAKFGIDKADLLIARSPQPTAVLLTSHDCFPIEGGRDAFIEVSKAFSAYGEEGLNLYMSESVGFHEVTDIGLGVIKQFFGDQLPTPFPRRSNETVQPFPCGKLLFGKKEMTAGIYQDWKPSTVSDLIRDWVRPMLQRLRARRRLAEVSGYFGSKSRSSAVRPEGRTWLRSLPKVSAFMAGVPQDIIDEVAEAAVGRGSGVDPIAARRIYLEDGGTEEWFILPTGGMCGVTLKVYSQPMASPDGVVTIIFGGEAEVNRGLTEEEDFLLTSLRTAGVGNAVFAGLCGQGDRWWRGGMWEFAPLLIGRTHAGRHAMEVLATVSWAFRNLKARQVNLISTEGTVASVLHAAVHIPSIAREVGGRLSAVVILRSIASLGDVATARRHRLPWQMQMYGVLQKYDLPDLLAAVAGRPGKNRRGPCALVVEPREPDGRRPMPKSKAASIFRLARRLFSAAGRRLRLLTGNRSSHFEAIEVATFLADAVRMQP